MLLPAIWLAWQTVRWLLWPVDQADDPLWATPGLVRLVQSASCGLEADDLGASDVLSAIRRLQPAVAQAVLGE